MYSDRKSVSNDLTLFKSRIIEKMKMDDITVSDLARETGINQSTLHKGIYGDREITYSNACVICRVLGLTLFTDQLTMYAPLITDIRHLDDASSIDSEEFIFVNKDYRHTHRLIDAMLFDEHLFPDRSIVIINTEFSHDQPPIFLLDGVLTFAASPGARSVGYLHGIIFRHQYNRKT